MAPIWLITGCSSGLGTALAHYVLSQGHNVIATSRDPSKTPDLVKTITSSPNGRWIQLDVTADAATVAKTITEASRLFGGIDILVNNAATSLLGAVEDLSESDAKAIFETNYWGPLKCIKAVLPEMRERKSGIIVNVSSIAGLTAMPTATLSEALSAELTSFNIRVIVVEPGAFRTRFLANETTNYTPVSAPYKGTIVEEVSQRFTTMNGAQVGDAEKGVKRIFESVTGTGMGEGNEKYLRLLIGKDCWDRASAQVSKMQENLKAMEEVAASTGFE